MKRRPLIVSLLIVTLLVGGCGVWKAKRQYALNRQLVAALTQDDTKTALALVNAGADPNTPSTASSPESLMWRLRRVLQPSPASTVDDPTAFLIACGGMARPKEEEAIHAAETLERVTLVQAMLAHGANTQARGWTGNWALLAAVANHHVSVADLLLQRGMSVHVADGQNKTPLHWAAINKSEAMTQLLLAQGADPNAQEAGGSSVLEYAVAFGSSAHTLQLLLEHGANPNLANRRGVTPLMTAKGMKHLELLRLLTPGKKPKGSP